MTTVAGNSVADRISAIMAEKFKVAPDAIDVTAEFSTMKLDSLDLVELAVILSDQYGVAVEDDEIFDAGTIEATVALLARKGVQAG